MYLLTTEQEPDLVVFKGPWVIWVILLYIADLEIFVVFGENSNSCKPQGQKFVKVFKKILSKKFRNIFEKHLIYEYWNAIFIF